MKRTMHSLWIVVLLWVYFTGLLHPASATAYDSGYTAHASNFALSPDLITGSFQVLEEHADINFDVEKSLRRQRLLSVVLLILIVALCILAYLLYNSSKKKMHHSASLEKLNNEKDHFIGVVAHDLRSPLSSIMALSGLLIEDNEVLNPSHIKEYGSIIQNCSQRMEHLISNMLDANRIDLRKTKLSQEAVSLNDVLIPLKETIAILGNEKNIHINVCIEEDIPEIHADPNAVYRVLENLVSNAFKFSSPDSTVSIFVTSEHDQVQIAIKDEGPGLTDLDKSKLFRKFEKLSATPTANEKSTGLGLFIVKHLVKEMNGTILVESELGKGTTFKVLFNKA